MMEKYSKIGVLRGKEGSIEKPYNLSSEEESIHMQEGL